jgi:histidyl-tRNA synthetase
MSEFLCGDCKDHFEDVKTVLSELSIKYSTADRLVRGFDYYTGTIFEINSRDLESAQNALGGGGRYDKLLSEFGGPDMPAIGFAVGLDRTIMLMKELGISYSREEDRVKAYILQITDLKDPFCLDILKMLRDAGIICEMDYGKVSVGTGIKKAGKKGFDVAVIIGDEEIKEDKVTIKDLKRFKQYNVSRTELVEKIIDVTGAK